MTINSINLAMAGSYGAYNQKLTAATKAKLNELGIMYNENTTEAEGRKMIQQYQVQKSEQSHNNQAQQEFSSDTQARNSLFEQAKRLAEKLNIVIPRDIDFNELLAKIEQALERAISNAKDEPSKLQMLQNLSRELASIQAMAEGSSGYDNTNKALMMSLEMLSEYNKQQINYLK